jgi:hypothetical protein
MCNDCAKILELTEDMTMMRLPQQEGTSGTLYLAG